MDPSELHSSFHKTKQSTVLYTGQCSNLYAKSRQVLQKLPNLHATIDKLGAKRTHHEPLTSEIPSDDDPLPPIKARRETLLPTEDVIVGGEIAQLSFGDDADDNQDGWTVASPVSPVNFISSRGADGGVKQSGASPDRRSSPVRLAASGAPADAARRVKPIASLRKPRALMSSSGRKVGVPPERKERATMSVPGAYGPFPTPPATAREEPSSRMHSVETRHTKSARADQRRPNYHRDGLRKFKEQLSSESLRFSPPSESIVETLELSHTRRQKSTIKRSVLAGKVALVQTEPPSGPAGDLTRRILRECVVVPKHRAADVRKRVLDSVGSIGGKNEFSEPALAALHSNELRHILVNTHSEDLPQRLHRTRQRVFASHRKSIKACKQATAALSRAHDVATSAIANVGGDADSDDETEFDTGGDTSFFGYSGFSGAMHALAGADDDKGYSVTAAYERAAARSKLAQEQAAAEARARGDDASGGDRPEEPASGEINGDVPHNVDNESGVEVRRESIGERVDGMKSVGDSVGDYGGRVGAGDNQRLSVPLLATAELATILREQSTGGTPQNTAGELAPQQSAGVVPGPGVETSTPSSCATCPEKSPGPSAPVLPSNSPENQTYCNNQPSTGSPGNDNDSVSHLPTNTANTGVVPAHPPRRSPRATETLSDLATTLTACASTLGQPLAAESDSPPVLPWPATTASPNSSVSTPLAASSVPVPSGHSLFVPHRASPRYRARSSPAVDQKASAPPSSSVSSGLSTGRTASPRLSQIGGGALLPGAHRTFSDPPLPSTSGPELHATKLEDIYRVPKHVFHGPGIDIPPQYHFIALSQQKPRLDNPAIMYSDQREMWHTVLFPPSHPHQRRDAILLQTWLALMLDRYGVYDESISPEVVDTALLLYSLAILEFVRQLSVTCSEQGELLATLLSKLFLIYRITFELLRRLLKDFEQMVERLVYDVEAMTEALRNFPLRLIELQETVSTLNSELKKRDASIETLRDKLAKETSYKEEYLDYLRCLTPNFRSYANSGDVLQLLQEHDINDDIYVSSTAEELEPDIFIDSAMGKLRLDVRRLSAVTYHGSPEERELIVLRKVLRETRDELEDHRLQRQKDEIEIETLTEERDRWRRKYEALLLSINSESEAKGIQTLPVTVIADPRFFDEDEETEAEREARLTWESLTPTFKEYLTSPPKKVPPVLPLSELLVRITTIYSGKISSDALDERDGHPKQALVDFIFDYFLQQYGSPTKSESELFVLYVTLSHHGRRENRDKSIADLNAVPVKVFNFCRFCGMYEDEDDVNVAEELNLYLGAYARLSDEADVGERDAIHHDEQGRTWVGLAALTAPGVLEKFFTIGGRRMERDRKDFVATLERKSELGMRVLHSKGHVRLEVRRIDFDVVMSHVLIHRRKLKGRHLQDLRTLFVAGDVNQDGHLSLSEFKEILYCVDPNRSNREVLRMYSQSVRRSELLCRRKLELKIRQNPIAALRDQKELLKSGGVGIDPVVFAHVCDSYKLHVTNKTKVMCLLNSWETGQVYVNNYLSHCESEKDLLPADRAVREFKEKLFMIQKGNAMIIDETVENFRLIMLQYARYTKTVQDIDELDDEGLSSSSDDGDNENPGPPPVCEAGGGGAEVPIPMNHTPKISEQGRIVGGKPADQGVKEQPLVDNGGRGGREAGEGKLQIGERGGMGGGAGSDAAVGGVRQQGSHTQGG
eukprot:Rmarinus@m.29075